MIFVKLLALALTNLVLDLVNLVTNLAKPRLCLDKIWARLETMIKQASPCHCTTRQLLKAGNLEFLLSEGPEFHRDYNKQAPPLAG